EFLPQVSHRPAHQSLDAEDGVLGVGQGAVAGGRPDQDRAVVEEADDAGYEGLAVLVADDDRSAVLHVGREAEGGAQMDADDGWNGHGGAVASSGGRSALFVAGMNRWSRAGGEKGGLYPVASAERVLIRAATYRWAERQMPTQAMPANHPAITSVGQWTR